VNTQCGPFIARLVGLEKMRGCAGGAAQGCIVGAWGQGGDATGAMRVGGRCNLRVDPLAEHLGDGCRACATAKGKQVMCACVGGEFLGVESAKGRREKKQGDAVSTLLSADASVSGSAAFNSHMFVQGLAHHGCHHTRTRTPPSLNPPLARAPLALMRCTVSGGDQGGDELHPPHKQEQ
jgi:hypothetical protein